MENGASGFADATTAQFTVGSPPGSVKYGNHVASVEKSRSRPYDPFWDLFSRLRVSGGPTGMVSRNKMMALSVHISIDLI